MQSHPREPYKDVPMPGHIVSHILVGRASGQLGSLVLGWECPRGFYWIYLYIAQPCSWAWGTLSGAPTSCLRYRAPAAAVLDICSPGLPCLLWGWGVLWLPSWKSGTDVPYSGPSIWPNFTPPTRKRLQVFLLPKRSLSTEPLNVHSKDIFVVNNKNCTLHLTMVLFFSSM